MSNTFSIGRITISIGIIRISVGIIRNSIGIVAISIEIISISIGSIAFSIGSKAFPIGVIGTRCCLIYSLNSSRILGAPVKSRANNAQGILAAPPEGGKAQ